MFLATFWAEKEGSSCPPSLPPPSISRPHYPAKSATPLSVAFVCILPDCLECYTFGQNWKEEINLCRYEGFLSQYLCCLNSFQISSRLMKQRNNFSTIFRQKEPSSQFVLSCCCPQFYWNKFGEIFAKLSGNDPVCLWGSSSSILLYSSCSIL